MKNFQWFLILVALLLVVVVIIGLTPNEMPSGFTDGYEAGDFSKFTTDAGGMLQGTPVYIEGVIESVIEDFEIQTDSFSSIEYLARVDEQHLVISCNGPMIHRRTTPESFVSTEVVVCGTYLGIVRSTGLPLIYVDQIFVKDTAGIYLRVASYY